MEFETANFYSFFALKQKTNPVVTKDDKCWESLDVVFLSLKVITFKKSWLLVIISRSLCWYWFRSFLSVLLYICQVVWKSHVLISYWPRNLQKSLPRFGNWSVFHMKLCLVGFCWLQRQHSKKLQHQAKAEYSWNYVKEKRWFFDYICPGPTCDISNGSKHLSRSPIQLQIIPAHL